MLCKQSYHHEVPEDAEFLTKSYFRYFEGREFTELRTYLILTQEAQRSQFVQYTYLILTQEAQRSQFVQYDPKKWLDFHSKVSKVSDILKEKNINHRKLTKEEVNENCHRFMAFQFRHGPFSMTNFKASYEYLKIGDRVVRSYPLVDIDEINLPSLEFRHGPFSMTNFKASYEYLKIGDRVVRSYPLVDIDEINLPSLVKPYTQMNINGYGEMAGLPFQGFQSERPPQGEE